VRPASRTFWVSASIHANVYGRVSTGRFRKPSHQVVQLRGHRADLRPEQPGHPEGRGELLHPHGRDPSRYDVSATEAGARSARRPRPRQNGITSRYAIRDAVAADRAKPEWTQVRDRSPPSNGDGQRLNPGHTRLLQGIEADNHRSEGSKASEHVAIFQLPAGPKPLG
jgi:hypothetical protein